jgi:hypothetical protein
MRTTLKMWMCLGAFTTLASGCAKQEPASAERAADAPAISPAASSTETVDAFRGDFAGALKQLFAGEGGEEGIGLIYDAGRVVVPPLNEAQVTEALTGNTLRRQEAFALHFESGGRFSGWEIKWETVDAAQCAKGEPNYELEEGTCWHHSDVKIPQGTWSVRDGMLCTQPALVTAANANECVSMFILLDDIALFDKSGKMIGKGNELVQGKHLETEMK